jgi:hypothetical protein
MRRAPKLTRRAGVSAPQGSCRIRDLVDEGRSAPDSLWSESGQVGTPQAHPGLQLRLSLRLGESHLDSGE